MDFVFLPPEINSTRIYFGPGAGPLLAAAGSWEALSAELSITAAGYESVVSSLTSLHWHGPTSAAMSAAATPYWGWLNATAEQAQQMAVQARAAAAAYELAYAMTVPPAAIAANRIQLLTLVATNFFGQNTAAIAATEAQYAQYWAQDVTAMSDYATRSASAAQLPLFSSPHWTSDPEGLAAQDAAVARSTAGSGPTSPVWQAVSAALPGATANLSSIIPTDLSVLNVIQAAGTTLSGTWKMEATPTGIIGAEKDLDMLPAAAESAESAPAAGSLGGGAGLGDVTATLSRANRLGSMSVPVSWTAPPSSGVMALSGSDVPTALRNGELTGIPGMPAPPAGTASRATSVVPRYGVRITVMARPPAAG